MAKKHIVYMILASASVSAIIILTAGSISVRERKNYYAQELRSENATETQPAIGYYLRAYDGKIAIFRGESDTPFRKLDVSLSIMSEYDKAVLEKGLYAEDEKTLKRMIEDYTS